MITVNARELNDLLAKNPGMALLNVRPAATAAEGCLKGSLHMPLAGPKDAAGGLLPEKAAPIAVYGTDFNCEASTKASDLLEKLGYTQIYNFTDGLKGWKAAKLPLVSPEP